jgi:hypothetical protein
VRYEPTGLDSGTLSIAGRPGCRLRPIIVGALGVHTWGMVQLAIRCHPCVPVPAGELEGWLERLVDGLRAEAGHGTVRLSRLMQSAPSAELDVGWLIELELPEGDPMLAGAWLPDAVRDMRLLGLQPTLLTAGGVLTNGRAA